MMPRTPWWPVYIVLLLSLVGCLKITDVDGNDVRLVRSEGQLAGIREPIVETELMKALLKGSIYETGEFVSVFGACLNSTDGGYIGSYATMSSWYPNGTQFFSNVSMQELSAGYFLYTGNMSAVQGTYLTEIVCRVNGTDEVAKAFGEWQNPYWVRRIALLNDSITGLNQSLSDLGQNITMQLEDINGLIVNTTNITWEKIDNISVLINTSYENITTLLYYVAGVANSSVDRNDSYLASLLQLIAASVGAPITQNLTIVEDAEATVYFRNWNIDVTVYNEYNVTVGSPVVSCFINTTNNPATVNQLMTWQESQDVFRHSEKVTTLPGVDFTWSTWCVYN